MGMAWTPVAHRCVPTKRRWNGCRHGTRKVQRRKMVFIYMLKRGTAGTSNTDPYAKEVTADNNWVKTGPHVMIVGAPK